jgi:hypothetical protein
MFSLLLRSHNTPAQICEISHRLGLSASPSTVKKMRRRLALACLEEARLAVLAGGHMLGYDNIQTSVKNVEQVPGAPPTVRSGSVSVIYPLRNAAPEHLRLQPILDRHQASPGLNYSRDVQPTVEQLSSFVKQSAFNIIDTLLEHDPAFHGTLEHLPDELRHPRTAYRCARAV